MLQQKPKQRVLCVAKLQKVLYIYYIYLYLNIYIAHNFYSRKSTQNTF